MSALLKAVIDHEPELPSPEPADLDEQWLKSIIESAPVSLMVLNASGKVLAANHVALKMQGAKCVEDVLGKGFCQHVVPHDRIRFARFVGDVCSGSLSETLEYDFLPFIGAVRAVETRAVPLRKDESSPVVFLGITQDVTERNRLERALRQAEARLDELQAERSANIIRQAAPIDEEQRHKALVEHEALMAILREADLRASAVKMSYEVDTVADDAQAIGPARRFWRRGR